jgi:hypothetical protein
VISLQNAEVAVPKNDSKSAAYEIRTKSAKSGGLETNGRTEREFRVTAGVSKCRGFRAKPVVIGLLRTLESQQRMFCADRLAEGVQLGSNHRLENIGGICRQTIRNFGR